MKGFAIVGYGLLLRTDMAERCLLHQNKLDLFRWYLESLGYEIQPAKNYYEVLRAKKDKDTVIIFTRSNAEHLTVQDKDYEFVRRFLKQQTKLNVGR